MNQLQGTRSVWRWVFGAWCCFGLWHLGFGASSTEFDFFERRIRPVLAQHCYECHSATSKSLKAGLRVDTRDGLRRGGNSGEPAVVPGEPENSRLLAAIRHTSADLQMPPKKKLSPQQLADFEAWIRSGAPDPRAGEVKSAKSEVQSSKPHWAFVAPKDQPLPKVKDKAWPQSPVDHFILAKLEANGLKPSPPADPRTLIRRMTYDLTGLPPSAEEVEAFVREFSLSHSPTFPPAIRDSEKVRKRESEQRAIAALVERLLASPLYGERWARHWLDVARYADTKGYVYAREERFFVHAHAYRDWVVRALNNDLPYDRFLMLQIAGDQLSPFRVGGALPDTAANSKPETQNSKLADLAALGFLTTGRRFIGVTHDILDDRIDVVTRGTMGLTVQCARCHDHKYDPIPTADYYSLYGVFHSTADELVQIEFPAQSDALAAFEKEYSTRLDKLNSTMATRRAEAAARVRARVTDYLAAQFELHKYPEEGFDQILTDNDLIPATVRRWQAYLEQARKRGDPVWALWHQHVGSSRREEAPSELGAGVRSPNAGANPNALLAAAFTEPPKSPREVAERYGKVFSTIEQQWQAALKAAKTNNSPAPTALPDPQAEALRQVLYAADSPAVIPSDGIVNTEQLFTTKATEELWKLQGEVDRHLIRAPGAPAHALIVTDRAPQGNPRVFLRGDPKQKGVEVPRQFLEVVAGPQRQPFAHGSGRLELARAIANAENPLTARVMVNRVWLHHFGAGLVKTPSDFGLRAEPPSHPELLDWLARRFVADGWSLKAVHRLLLTSAAYQQAGEFSVFSSQPSVKAEGGGRPTENRKLNPEYWKRATALDPDNHLLWRANRQRLDFEELRDSLLAASGELDLTPGGRPADVFTSKRRSLYGLVDRQYLPPLFRVFDFANPDLHIPQRHETTVSQQALFFLNHPFVAARAKALVARADFSKLSSPEEKVRFLHRALFQREPTSAQTAAAVRFIADAEANQPQTPKPPPENQWRYGYGEFDEPNRKLKNFTALPHFTGKAWQGGPNWPDAKLGWAQLTADGGHAGNDLQHAVVRRWIAPRDCVVNIAGRIAHETSAGDGVRAFITHSRLGQLRTVTVHNAAEDLRVPSTAVQAGDTLDFIVDFRANLNSDEFKWAPVITELNTAAAVVGAAPVPVKEWDAKKDFRGVDVPAQPPLKPWEQLAQVLLSANEFLFVD